jgi:hypothetical protein
LHRGRLALVCKRFNRLLKHPLLPTPKWGTLCVNLDTKGLARGAACTAKVAGKRRWGYVPRESYREVPASTLRDWLQTRGVGFSE